MPRLSEQSIEQGEVVRKFLLTWLVVCSCVLGVASNVFGQGAPPPQAGLLRIFLDCNSCDSEFLKTEIKFVDYMRDRKDADLHVLVTTQNTGAGGTAWTLKFIGLNTFEGQTNTMTFSTERTATDDDERKDMARVLKIGLAAYAAGTPAIKSLNVTYAQPTAAAGAAAPKKDPWN